MMPLQEQFARVVAGHESLPPSGTFGGRGTYPFGVRSPRGTPKTIGAGGDGLFQGLLSEAFHG
jgi:hypothetical protein